MLTLAGQGAGRIVTQTQTTRGRKDCAWEIAAFRGACGPCLRYRCRRSFHSTLFRRTSAFRSTPYPAIFLGVRIADIIDPHSAAFRTALSIPGAAGAFGFRFSCLPLMALIWFVFIGMQPGVSVAVTAVTVFLLYFVYASMMLAHLGWRVGARPITVAPMFSARCRFPALWARC